MSLQGGTFLGFQDLALLNFHMITVDSEYPAAMMIHLPDTNLKRSTTTILTIFSCSLLLEDPLNFQTVLANVNDAIMFHHTL